MLPGEDVIHVTEIKDRYDIIAEIGKGTYGEVYKVRDKHTNAILALKKINILQPFDGFPLNTIREIKILQSQNHENVIGLRAIVDSSTEERVYLAFDYCEFDLYGLLYYSGETLLTEKHIACYIKQILLALKVCNDCNIVHRDLKPANIFITRNNILKLGDFGLARKIVEERDARYTSNVITLYYRPPELLFGCQIYAYEVDIWSVGCIIYEMITKKYLFQSERAIEAKNLTISQLKSIFTICGIPDSKEWPEITKLDKDQLFISQGPKPSHLLEHLQNTIPPEFSDAIDLLVQMLQLNPSKRISAEKAHMHPFLKKYGIEIEPNKLPPLNVEELHQMAVSAEKKKREAEQKTAQLRPEQPKPDVL